MPARHTTTVTMSKRQRVNPRVRMDLEDARLQRAQAGGRSTAPKPLSPCSPNEASTPHVTATEFVFKPREEKIRDHKRAHSCVFPDCTKGASWGLEDTGKRRWCAGHGKEQEGAVLLSGSRLRNAKRRQKEEQNPSYSCTNLCRVSLLKDSGEECSPVLAPLIEHWRVLAPVGGEATGAEIGLRLQEQCEIFDAL